MDMAELPLVWRGVNFDSDIILPGILAGRGIPAVAGGLREQESVGFMAN
jgi:hypothetical protein